MALTINNLTTAASAVPVRTPAIATTPPVKADKNAQDAVTLSGAQGADPLTYADPRNSTASAEAKALPQDLQAMLDESNQKVDQIMAYLRPLLEQQGLNFAKLASGEQKLNADPAQIEAAKTAISEDGEFGVRKTAERILSFAKFATGGSADQLDTIRSAVEKGFNEAKQIFGGTLPDISEQTYKAVMGELDRWAKDGIPTGDTVSLSRPDKSPEAVKA